MSSMVAPIDLVRADINAAAPSAQTLRHLRALLGLEQPNSLDAPQCKSHKTSRPQKSSRIQPATQFPPKRKDQTPADVRVRKQNVRNVSEAGQENCRKLATEVFNTTLKQLGLAAKTAKESRISGDEDGQPVRLAPTQRPLQEQSPNRGKSTGRKDEKQMATEAPRQDWSITADCALFALQYLIDIGEAQDAKRSDQIAGFENASLILLDRTITLGLVAQAESQANHIFRQYWRAHTTTCPCPVSQIPNVAQYLLGRPDSINDGSIFGFTTSMQSQMLRLMIQYGPTCINNELVTSLKLDTVGSPAWLCLQGSQQNRQNSQQTGNQLRTISLAISKLYSLATGSKTARPLPDDLFELFGVAMSIKFASWEHLHHKLDSHNEFWRHFISATKRYIISAQKPSCAGQSILGWLRSFQHLLNVLGQDNALPSDLLDLLLRGARQLKCEREIYSLAGKEGTKLDPIMSLVSECQIASSRLGNYTNETDMALNSVLKTRDLLSQAITSTSAGLERILLYAVQLRKALLYVIQDIQDSRQSGKSVATLIGLESRSYEVIHICIGFLFDQIQHTLVNTGQNLEGDRKKTLLSTLIKNADSLVQIEKCCTSRATPLLHVRKDPLEYAVEMVTFLQTQVHHSNNDESPLLIALNQIQIRISQAYWARYIQSVEQRNDSENQRRILEKSISTLTSLSITDQKAAFLGLKYQRLASCYADLHDFKASKVTLQQAIEFDIKLGSLREAAEMALTGPSQNIWSKPDSNCVSLGKSLAMFANMALAESASSERHVLLYDSTILPPVQRAIMFERQACGLLEKALNEKQLLHVASQLRFLLPVLDQPKYRVFRLRLVSSLIAARLKKRMTIIGTLLTTQQIRDILEPDTTLSEAVYLPEFEPSLQTILQLQHDISTGQLSSATLGNCLKTLGDMIVKCETPDSLRKIIDDPDGFMNLLHLCVGYANMLENHQAAHAALEMMRVVMGHGHQSPFSDKASILIQIGRSYLRLQNVESAHTALHAAQVSITAQSGDTLVEIDLALAYAEHYFTTEDVQKCLSYLDRARSIWETRMTSQSPSNNKMKLKEKTLLCTSAHLTSRLAFYQGNLLQAAICARQSVKVIAAVWISVSKVWVSQDSTDPDGKEDSGMQNLTVDFSKLDLSSSHHSGHTIASAAVYWQEISLYCSAFSHMASLLAHCGLYCDAVYFYEQGLKVATQANLAIIMASIRSELALLHARAGQLERARLLQSLPEPGPRTDACLTRKFTMTNQAEVHLLLGDIPTACKLLSHVEGGSLEPKNDAIISKVKSKATNNLTRAPSKRSAPKARKDTKHVDQQSAKSTSNPLEMTVGQKTLFDRLAVLQVHMRLHKPGENVSISPVASLDNTKSNPRKVSLEALYLVRSALRLFSEDAVHNVLAETAVALPVRYKSSRKSGRISFSQDVTVQDVVLKSSQRKGKASGSIKKDAGMGEDGRALLLRAHQSLASLRSVNSSQVPSEAVHALHKLLSQTALLSTALGDFFVPSSVEILADALSPLDQLRLREAIITSSEKATSANSALSDWPQGKDTIPSRNVTETSADLLDRIELLPASWSVVSIGLAEDRTELLVARMSRHRSPFVLRIPLTRPDPSAMDHEELDFDGAKVELENIVLEANASAHDPRGSAADKTVRKSWFTERQSLDGRLAALLDNIENIWFGGFRGLLSARGTDDKALAKFAQSLSNTLNRHLPSRQKPSRAGKAVKIELHSHVLELFLTLGHPGESDLEDSVTDLIYFVVDVLQFNGENNAYDEIDFDAMLVEILDALHAYHEDVSSKTLDNESSHVILVMDKELQGFPWESLPCMRDQSVSRMPSLGAIWERLEKMKTQHASRAGYVLPACKGTYILNPASDLVSTEEAFRSVFETQLPTFKAIVNRSPTETEFETALQDSPLVLYFGHGGGAQYIRGRTIRKLQQCAVTLLMGCSSAKLSECGVYESHGMPWNYINGGSAAVVGTLWDVTDRDIDRFAMEMMSGWGLVDKAETMTVKDGKRKAGRDKPSKLDTHKPVKMSLDQAIARARDSCLLKYLNGAAPVMYGIPVFLE